MGRDRRKILAASFFDCGQDDFGIFASEESVLAGVWIKSANHDTRIGVAQQTHIVVAQKDGGKDAFTLEIAGLPQGDMRRYVDHGKSGASKQHPRLVHSAELRDVFGVTRNCMPV